MIVEGHRYRITIKFIYEKKFMHVSEVDPEEFKNEILAGVEKLLKDFSKQFEPKVPEIWMSRKEVGELLGVSLVTVHNWSKEGVLTAYKIGIRVRFRKSDIDQTLLSSNRRSLK